MRNKSSKRITLGTYSKLGLFNSFSEGDYHFVGGLKAALEDVRKLIPKDGKPPSWAKSAERGVCVAVFPIGMGRTRVLVKYPWSEVEAGL